MAWSDPEIEAIVDDYFDMLGAELRFEPYSKTEHRRRLQPLLTGRSAPSIERKHQNISAILRDARFPYIKGYQPLSNYQARLAEIVIDRLGDDAAVHDAALAAVDAELPLPVTRDLLSRVSAPPSIMNSVRDAVRVSARERRARRIDYFAREAGNRALGLAGEQFVVAFERQRLESLHLHRLAARVEHVSVTQGDGLGFDVLSFSEDGSDRFIEVKTTQFGADAPFYVSEPEVRFSAEKSSAFDLYRVYDFRTDVHLFQLHGSISESCVLRPAQFSALPR